MRTRSYGTTGPLVIVLHGGPAAPGYMATVARGLEDTFQVIEPFQRGSGSRPLSVARHVADLLELLGSLPAGSVPALLGHSWGAMLALAFAATHPDRVSALVLVGCGSFDRIARARLDAIVEERTDERLRRQLQRLPLDFPDANERLVELGKLLLPAYSCELATLGAKVEAADDRAHEETWADMVRLQDAGIYPAAFARISAPVLMLHGADDPHPGRLIRDSLVPFIRRLEYHEWQRCGHYPWLERAVGEKFYEVVREWLARAVYGS